MWLHLISCAAQVPGAALPAPTLWTPRHVDAEWTPAPWRSLTADAATVTTTGTLWSVVGSELRELDTGTLAPVRRVSLPAAGPFVAVAVSPLQRRALVVAETGDAWVLEVDKPTQTPVPLERREGFAGVEAIAVADDGAVDLAWRATGRDCLQSWSHTEVEGEGTSATTPVRLNRGLADAEGAWLAPDRRLTNAFLSADRRWLVVKDEAGWAVQGPLADADRGIRAPAQGPIALSPAGRWLLVAQGPRLTAWDLRVGAPVWAELPGAVRALAWDAAGTRFAVLSGDGPGFTVTAYDFGEAAPVRRWAKGVSGEQRSSVALAFDGERVLYQHDNVLLLVEEDRNEWSVHAARTVPRPPPTISLDGAHAAWRSRADRVEVLAVADGSVVQTHTGRVGELALVGGKLRARSKKERLILDVVTGEVTEGPGGCGGGCRLQWLGSVATGRLGRRTRPIDWKDIRGDLGYAGSDAEAPQVSGDGTVAWADDDGRVWVETDDHHPPRLLTGPALRVSMVAFNADGTRLFPFRRYAHGVVAHGVHVDGAERQTEAEARAEIRAGQPSSSIWVSPDAVVVARTDPSGVVTLTRRGEATPFRAVVDWPSTVED